MPGIAGFVSFVGKPVKSILTNMLSRLTSPGEIRTDEYIWPNGNMGVAAKTLPLSTPLFQVRHSENGTKTLFVKGEIYNTTSEKILSGFGEKGESFFSDNKDLDGIFSGGIVDIGKNKLFLFSDPFGIDPLYYCQEGYGFGFSSEIKAFLALPGFSKKVNLETLVDLWTHGFAVGDKTPFHQVHLLSPGTLLSLDLSSGEKKITPYWNIIDLFSHGRESAAPSMDSVADAFFQAVQVRSGDILQTKLGVSLSGGLDSRAILGAMPPPSNRIKTYTLGLPGCADERLAAKMALLLGTAHEFIPITESDLSDFESLAAMMVTLSDGLYHPHESTEKVALDYLASRPFEAMLRGHGGEIAKASLAYPFQATNQMAGMSPGDTIAELNKKAGLAKSDIGFASLFKGDVLHLVQNTKENSLEKEAGFAVNTGISNLDLCVYLYITQWIRRQVVASLSLFRTRVEIRLPYLDRNFLSLLLSLPAENRWSGEFHRFFVNKYCPQLMKVPDSNTGSPLDAGKCRMFLTDKINAVLKRLGITGFRHYTEFQKWQRKYFRDATEKILLDERTLARGYYQSEGLQEIMYKHNSGQSNYAHFLGTAVGIELWHRNFVDGELDK